MGRFLWIALAVLIVGVGCTGGNLPPEASPHEGEPRTVPQQVAPVTEGFVGWGPYQAASTITGREVSLVESSVSVSEAGPWQAVGLVRNQLATDVGEVIVTARLYAADGILLDEPSALVPVDRVRPGEPAPFLITSTVDSGEVATVEWLVRSGSPHPSTSRRIALRVISEEPAGVDKFRGKDRLGPPYPYRLRVAFDNLDGPLDEAVLAVAWVDEETVVATAPSFRSKK